VFKNRVLRRIFGPKRDEVTGEWRKLHNEELHILYSSGRGEESVLGFGGKPEGKRPLGGPRHRWENGIRMDLREIG
jgi:hypothetical protein